MINISITTKIEVKLRFNIDKEINTLVQIDLPNSANPILFYLETIDQNKQKELLLGSLSNYPEKTQALRAVLDEDLDELLRQYSDPLESDQSLLDELQDGEQNSKD